VRSPYKRLTFVQIPAKEEIGVARHQWETVVHNRMQCVCDIVMLLDFPMDIDEPYHLAISYSHIRDLCPPKIVQERNGRKREATCVDCDALASVVAVRLPADVWTAVAVDVRRQIGSRVSALLQEDNVRGQG